MPNKNQIGTIALLLLIAIALFGSVYTIDQGTRGVILRMGAVAGIAEPGLGFKIPLVDKIVPINVQTNSVVYRDMEAYSRDQQLAEITVSVTYRLLPDEVDEVYAQYGGAQGIVSRLIDRRVNEMAKTVFGQFNASEAIQERAKLNAQIAAAIAESVSGPLLIESIQIEDVAFSLTYEASIEARMLAEVEVQKRTQELEQQRVQAQITVTQAQAEADSRLAQAEASAKATRLAGEAEADAIRARGAALRDNPALVARVTAEAWNGVLPSTMVPGSAVPFISVAGE
jgi:regulator of protease activity HflC (stomatin/prohibitin superfamily)